MANAAVAVTGADVCAVSVGDVIVHLASAARRRCSSPTSASNCDLLHRCGGANGGNTVHEMNTASTAAPGEATSGAAVAAVAAMEALLLRAFLRVVAGSLPRPQLCASRVDMTAGALRSCSALRGHLSALLQGCAVWSVLFAAACASLLPPSRRPGARAARRRPAAACPVRRASRGAIFPFSPPGLLIEFCLVLVHTFVFNFGACGGRPHGFVDQISQAHSRNEGAVLPPAGRGNGDQLQFRMAPSVLCSRCTT